LNLHAGTSAHTGDGIYGNNDGMQTFKGRHNDVKAFAEDGHASKREIKFATEKKLFATKETKKIVLLFLFSSRFSYNVVVVGKEPENLNTLTQAFAISTLAYYSK